MGLKEKLLAREATLGVIGLGYVGLPLAVEKAKAGFKVYGFDVQKEKVDMVNAGKNYIGDVVNEDLEALVASGMEGTRLLDNNMRKITPDDARYLYQQVL